MSEAPSAPVDGGQGAPPPVTPPVDGAAAPPAAPAEPTPPWFSAFKNPELRGYAEKKNFPDPEAAVASYFQLEKFHGVPAERILKLPEDVNDAEAVKPILERLNYVAPKEAKEYGFADMEGAQPEQAEALSAIAHKHGVPLKTAQAVFKDVIALDASNRDNMMKQVEEEVAAELGQLRGEWTGERYDQNMEKGRRFVRAIGFSEEQLQAIETSTGVGALFKTFAAAHDKFKLGESAFVEGSGKKGFDMSAESARSEINRLKTDTDFGARLMAGNAEAKEKWTRLNQIVAADSVAKGMIS